MDRTILYDGSCNMCNRAVVFVRKHDQRKKINYLPIQSDEGMELITNAGLQGVALHSIIYFSGERHYLRSSAILNILKDLGGGWKIFYIFIIIPPFFRDFIYNIIAESRYYFSGRSDKCSL